MPRTHATRTTLAWGREAIVSLTQTEIMLVLAAIVLVLLLVKDGDLTATKTDLAEAEERNSRLTEKRTASGDAVVEQQEQVDLASEVKEVLVRSGAAPPDENGSARLSPRDVTTVERMVEEQGQQEAETAAVDRALERAGLTPAGKVQPKQQQIDQLGSAALLGEALRKGLSPERQRALQDALDRGEEGEVGVGKQDGPLAYQGEALEELLAEWLRDGPQQGSGLGDQVGFDPCWPGPGGVGARRYYIAYDLTYADERYVVRPHSDWRVGLPIVDEALSGPLSVLRSYPRAPASTQEMLVFGRRINAALSPLRENGSYAPECLLVATLNEEASGKIAKFLRQDVGLYPITR